MPVGLAFFVRGTDGAVVAHYPSPLGSTQWEVDAGGVAGRRAPLARELADLAPEVEALLVNTARGARRALARARSTTASALVAVVRREWRGLSGGSRVWPAIDQFFAELQPAPLREDP